MKRYFFDYEQINLINFFVYAKSTPKNFYENSEIRKKLKISATHLNTIYDKLEYLSTLYPEFKFIRISKGCNVSFSSEFSLNRIYNIFFKSSLNYKLLNEIYYDQFINLSLFSDKVHFSSRTIQRSSKRLEAFLSKFNLSLKFSKSHPLEGEEYEIRFFFERLNWELFDEQIFIDEVLDISSNNNLFNKLCELFPKLQKIDIYRFTNVLYLSKIRIKNNHIIEKLPSLFEELVNPLLQYEDFVNQILTPYLENGGFINSKSLKKESRYLYGVITLLTNYDVTWKNKPVYENLDLSKISKCFVSGIENLININFSKTDVLYLRQNFTRLLIRFHIFRTNQIINPILTFNDKQAKLYIDKITEIVLNQCAEKYKNWDKLLLDDLFKLRVTSLLKSIFKKYVPLITICLISKEGGIEIRTWVEELKQLNFGKIKFITTTEKSDIIISDFPIDKSIHSFKDKSPKWLTWSPLLEEQNLLNAIKVISEVQHEKLERVYNNFSNIK